MVGSRTLTALAGLLASLVVSVVAYVYFDTFLLFLFLPFVPFLFRRRGSTGDSPRPKQCPVCGFRTRDPEYHNCPRDGTELVDAADDR
ncbi:hypothetical protein SAMN04487948_12157 [Halogranum amylolyticum]|uniref:Uncharacterized protein n=1 Tax=Halogranum amylolyticum TaxID=660520 RepID=A0A1H8VZT3_9EURY|nr:hypothetical protein [Halogranum amylolyticum]SEP20763.1 hypothetical protein SAMN04487948_12157 [Halogranum amylolyticum]